MESFNFSQAILAEGCDSQFILIFLGHITFLSCAKTQSSLYLEDNLGMKVANLHRISIIYLTGYVKKEVRGVNTLVYLSQVHVVPIFKP